MPAKIAFEGTADYSRVQSALKKLQDEHAKLKAKLVDMAQTSKRVSKEDQNLARATKKIKDQATTAQDRYNQRVKTASTLLEQQKITQREYVSEVGRAKTELDAAGLAGQDAFGAKALGMVKSLAVALGLGGGVAGMIGLINKGYEVWLTNARETATVTRKVLSGMVAFAALQEGGTKKQRVLEAAALGAEYSISDPGEAYATVQALQSIYGGDFAKGMEASKTVFAASQVGVDIDLGRELEVMGASQGMAPGAALRKAYVAGQLSGRDPATLARAAGGLKFFEDKAFAMSAASVIAESVRPEQLGTYLKQAGIALAETGPAAKGFARLGIGADATRQERLAALARAGIDTEAELKKFGFTEQRGREALLALVPNYQKVVQRQTAIQRQAVPGLFAQQRAGIEGELPTMKTTRQTASLQAEAVNLQVLGPGAEPAAQAEQTRAIRALAFRRLGREQALWFDVIEGTPEAPESSIIDEWQYRLSRTFIPKLFGVTTPQERAYESEGVRDPLTAEMEKIRREVEQKELLDAVNHQTTVIQEGSRIPAAAVNLHSE